MIIWAYSSAEKKKQKKKKKKPGDGFLLFLKAFSWETDLWVMLVILR